MKNALLIVLFICCGNIICPAQVFESTEKYKTPEAYAADMTDFYTRALSLSAQQKQETYITLLEKRKNLDSIRDNHIQVSNKEVWAINVSLDKKYKKILSQRQYLDYEQLQSHRLVTFKGKE